MGKFHRNVESPACNLNGTDHPEFLPFSINNGVDIS